MTTTPAIDERRPPLRMLAIWALLTLPLLLGDRSLAYDDHLEPAVLWQQTGARPAPDACWECHQPPLYYALEAAAFALVGADTASTRLAVARALTFALATLLWGVGWALARRLCESPRERLMAWLFFLTLPACFLLHVTLSNDVAAVALAGVAFALLAGVTAPGQAPANPLRFALLGLVAGSAVLAKTSALPVAAVALVATWVAGGVGAARWRAFAATLAGVLVPLAPWLGQNLVVSGRLLPLRMQSQVYAPADPGYFTSFRFLDLLAEPFRAAPGATFLSHLDSPGPVDGSWLTRLYSLFFHESLGYLPPLWPPLVAALYVAGLLVVGFVLVGAWRAVKRPHPGGLDRLALLLAATSFGLLVAFNLAYPSRLLVHGKAVFVMPAWPALFLLYVRGVQAAREWGGRGLAAAVTCAHLTVQTLFVAHAVAVVTSLVG